MQNNIVSISLFILLLGIFFWVYSFEIGGTFFILMIIGIPIFITGLFIGAVHDILIRYIRKANYLKYIFSNIYYIVAGGLSAYILILSLTNYILNSVRVIGTITVIAIIICNIRYLLNNLTHMKFENV